MLFGSYASLTFGIMRQGTPRNIADIALMIYFVKELCFCCSSGNTSYINTSNISCKREIGIKKKKKRNMLDPSARASDSRKTAAYSDSRSAGNRRPWSRRVERSALPRDSSALQVHYWETVGVPRPASSASPRRYAERSRTRAARSATTTSWIIVCNSGASARRTPTRRYPWFVYE